ncbi:hypothetical protein RMSM_03929 [Rhodopirellula maiorica SM1]|uniref:Uncharacterized protein n=1 Tax=Rhodopirellula maiorica SM1 TaxID=1265738 RepID=M5RUT6_9BACT|nr:hypothetical protein RMSM_03929 [Rhodopirellula maiorica SM1]
MIAVTAAFVDVKLVVVTRAIAVRRLTRRWVHVVWTHQTVLIKRAVAYPAQRESAKRTTLDVSVESATQVVNVVKPRIAVAANVNASFA